MVKKRNRKNKKLLIKISYLSVVFIFLILLVLIPNISNIKITGNAMTQVSSCSDSDKGTNYFVKGTAAGRTDTCKDTNTLIEYNCFKFFNTYVVSSEYTCLRGCVNGACLQQGNGHTANMILIKVDEFKTPLQTAINNFFLKDYSGSRISNDIATQIISVGHNSADEIFVSVNGNTKTLTEAIEIIPDSNNPNPKYKYPISGDNTIKYVKRGLCPTTIPATDSVDKTNIENGHSADEIEMMISGTTKTLQSAINNGDFCCVAKTCAESGISCGILDNGCGGINCGTCLSEQICYNNACCTPRTCANIINSLYPSINALATCGTFNDGCGSTINCGTCPSGKSCFIYTCITPINMGGGGSIL